MGRILHRQQLRRQFGLVAQQPAQGFTTEDRNWLRSQGIDRPDQLPRKSLWHKPDGTGSLGPSDLYQLALYRQRGLTLKSPTTPEPVHRGPMPLLARKLVAILGEGQQWQGSPTEPAGRCGVSPVALPIRPANSGAVWCACQSMSAAVVYLLVRVSSPRPARRSAPRCDAARRVCPRQTGPGALVSP